MSTTYSATATKDKDSKDKDSTETSTYVRSSDTTSDSTTTGKNATSGKNKSGANTDSDKSHDQDNTSSSQYRSSGTTGQYGSNTTGNQYGQDSSMHSQQQQRGGAGASHNQQDVQQKLKEVGSLLQKAGHLLQDLQGCSSSDFQSSSWNSSSRGQGGNFSGPFDQSYGSGQGHLGQSWNSRFEGDRSERSQYGQQSGRFQDSDREEMRGVSGRGGMYGRQEDRFEMSRQQGPQERSSYDRFSGFGGPNRPDMAYGQQYGQRGNFHGEVRHGSEFESSGRRGGDRW